jgi:hypothetical protein
MTEQFMENISNEEHERLLLLCGHGTGPALSFAAQAVLDAAINVAESPDAEAIAAAALRAAADQVIPEVPLALLGSDYQAIALQEARAELLAIADELEGACD